jgi:uncharacterized protein YciI
VFFLVLATDRPGLLERRLEHRQRHLDYWNGKAGAVKVAGAMLDGDSPKGSAFVLKAEDEAAARKLLADDPFTTEGIFGADIRIEAFRPAIGDWKPA